MPSYLPLYTYKSSQADCLSFPQTRELFVFEVKKVGAGFLLVIIICPGQESLSFLKVHR